MLELIVLGVAGLALFAFVELKKGASALAQHLPGGIVPASPGQPQVTPGGPAPAGAPTFPIPDSTSFVSRMIPAKVSLGSAGGPLDAEVQVAAFQLNTQKAMVQALSAREWRIGTMFATPGSTTTIFLIGAPTLDIAANADVLSAARIAAAAGQNVYFDADTAFKLTGFADVTSATFMMFDPGVPPPDPSIANEGVAATPEEATAAIQPGFVGSRFVLFAQAGESF